MPPLGSVTVIHNTLFMPHSESPLVSRTGHIFTFTDYEHVFLLFLLAVNKLTTLLAYKFPFERSLILTLDGKNQRSIL